MPKIAQFSSLSQTLQVTNVILVSLVFGLLVSYATKFTSEEMVMSEDCATIEECPLEQTGKQAGFPVYFIEKSYQKIEKGDPGYEKGEDLHTEVETFKEASFAINSLIWGGVALTVLSAVTLLNKKMMSGPSGSKHKK